MSDLVGGRSVPKVVRLFAGMIGIAVIAVALWRDHATLAGLVRTPGRLVVGTLCSVGGVATGVFGWIVPFRRTADVRALISSFVLSQPGKYLPGGITHIASVVMLANKAGVTRAQVATWFVVHSGLQVVAGCVIGTLVLAEQGGFGPAAALVVVGTILLALHLRLLTFALTAVGRRLERLRWWQATWRHADLVLTFYVSVLSLALNGLAFAVLLSAEHPGKWLIAVGAFSMGWVAGFVALPFPAGIGVREVVVAALLGSVAATTTVATVVAARVLALLGEAIVLAAVATFGGVDATPGRVE